MGRHKLNVLPALFACALIASSPGLAEAQTRNFAYADKSSTLPLLGVAARNAARLPGTSVRASDTVVIVTYRGEPQDFVICKRDDADVSGDLVLDLRSTLESQGPRLAAASVYIVTDINDKRVSLVFNGVEEGKAGDLSCRATGAMERKLLGVK
jgi:hypothetical protein